MPAAGLYWRLRSVIAAPESKMKKMPAAALLVAAFACAIQAGTAQAQQSGQIKRMEGDVRIVRGGQTLLAKPGHDIRARDRIVTGANGAAGFTTPDNGMFSLGPNSQMIVDEIAFNRQTQDGNIAVRFLKGTFSVVTGILGKIAPQKTRIQTPTATIGVRGTEFSVRVDVPPELEKDVLEGKAPPKPK
jgi:hypothetical protein